MRKTLNLSKFIAFADTKLNVIEIIQIVFEREENMVKKKKRKCLLPEGYITSYLYLYHRKKPRVFQSLS